MGLHNFAVSSKPLELGALVHKPVIDEFGFEGAMGRALDALRKGAGRAELAHMIEVARQRGYETLSLETGANPALWPAQKRYQSFGFTCHGPFSSYREDSNSVFMSLRLGAHTG